MPSEPVEVGGIWLRRSVTGEITVLAEVDSRWLVVIGPESDNGIISHIVEPSGIRKGAPDPVGA